MFGRKVMVRESLQTGAGTREKLTVLEGEWPYTEGITIERFRSMKALTDFWHSDAYQNAKKLREGASQINFIVALEGAPPTPE